MGWNPGSSGRWVAQSTRPDTSPDSLFKGDCYYALIWEGRRRGESEYDFDAEGHYGQQIYVSPHKNLIIVRNGEAYGEFGQTWEDIFCQFVSDIELKADE